jgi:SAM-dependent methyltransferase
MSEMQLPSWAQAILRCPQTSERLHLKGNLLVRADGTEAARIDNDIVRFPVSLADDSITFYRKVGGTHFQERAGVPFAMSSLDTPIYHSYLNEILPKDPDHLVVDVGGGDGRNAGHCLRRGVRRLVVIDAVAEALLRFRKRVAEQNPAWLGRLLLIEADARRLPLSSACAASVFAVESLCYLNEEYEVGLTECVRVLLPSGKILISDRDYEGGLILRLLYHGLDGMLQLAHNRSLWDGPPNLLVRTRCFTPSELVEMCRQHGIEPVRVAGSSLLSLLLGYLNGRSQFGASDLEKVPEVMKLLKALAIDGTVRRCNIVIGELRQD